MRDVPTWRAGVIVLGLCLTLVPAFPADAAHYPAHQPSPGRSSGGPAAGPAAGSAELAGPPGPGHHAASPALGTAGRLAPPRRRAQELRRGLASGPTGARLHRLAQDGRYRAVTTIPRTGRHLREPADDPVTFDECANHGGNDHYWFKSRFSMCYREQRPIVYLARNQQGVVYEQGRSLVAIEFIGIAQPRQTQINFGVRLRHLADHNLTRKTDRLRINLVCANHDTTRHSVCDRDPQEPAGGTELTVQQWQDRGGAPLWSHRTGTTARVPDDLYRDEKRGYFTFTVELTLTGPLGGTSDHFTPEYFRCDLADYVATTPRCVFHHVSSEIRMRATDTRFAESAQLIRDAQTDITLTKPGIVGKKVPGKVGEKPLTRLIARYDTTRSKDASRRKIRRVCQHNWGLNYTKGPNGQKRQCDEYPLASTYENAARVDNNTVWDYAVRALDAEHNRAAGEFIEQFRNNDHVLDGDPFYITITT
ncbi:hypothetical protein GCM10023088_48530 [Actinomadura verrucosospora]|uniref:NucA/NucB deoxyribonuclease domain-containing protein n=1 Tax=Actinomadura verrucosospora TaxID=46165 RepID=UPI0031EE27B0